MTVIRNEGDVLPFKPASGDHVLLVGAWSNEQPGMELTMRRLIDEKVIPADVTYESLNYAESYSSPDAALADITPKIADADYVVVISEVGSTINLNPDRVSGSSTYVPTRVVHAANEAGVPVAVMSISLPYDCAVYDKAPAVVAVYGNKGMDPTEGLQPSAAFGPNVPAGVEVIFGGHAAQGKLPVDLYDVKVEEGVASFDLDTVKYPYGYGLEYPGVNDVPPTDFSALANAVSDVEKNVLPNKDTYTAESFAALMSAYDQAKSVLADSGATQDEIDAALAALNEAREALVAAGVDVPPADEKPSGSGSTSGTKKPAGTGKIPETGDPTAFAAVATAAVAGAATLGLGAFASRATEDEE